MLSICPFIAGWQRGSTTFASSFTAIRYLHEDECLMWQCLEWRRRWQSQKNIPQSIPSVVNCQLFTRIVAFKRSKDRFRWFDCAVNAWTECKVKHRFRSNDNWSSVSWDFMLILSSTRCGQLLFYDIPAWIVSVGVSAETITHHHLFKKKEEKNKNFLRLNEWIIPFTSNRTQCHQCIGKSLNRLKTLLPHLKFGIAKENIVSEECSIIQLICQTCK